MNGLHPHHIDQLIPIPFKYPPESVGTCIIILKYDNHHNINRYRQDAWRNGSTMAYPEPIPVIRGKDAEEFLERLRRFKLTPAQKRLYKGARQFYERKRPKEP